MKLGIGRHSEHVVARNIFPVKTQRDDRVLSAVSLTTYTVGEAEKYASSQSAIGETKMASATRAQCNCALRDVNSDSRIR